MTPQLMFSSYLARTEAKILLVLEFQKRKMIELQSNYSKSPMRDTFLGCVRVPESSLLLR
jgi:hypothetical protein